tara:strand:+ start:50 stop:322 length:273 start_codon:yes stop_codon:yes gene_type:complete
MATSTSEKIWKVFTVVLGVIIMPLAGWVWNTNVALAQLQNDLGDAEDTVVMIEKKLSESDTNSKAIISIEKDIEYMKQTLGRIETLVASL